MPIWKLHDRLRVLAWGACGFSANDAVKVKAEDAEGRQPLAGTRLRAPMSLETMLYGEGHMDFLIA